MIRFVIYALLLTLFVYQKLMKNDFILTMDEAVQLGFDIIILLILILVAELREKIEHSQ